MERLDETELIDRLKQSDKEAYLALYDKYHLLVYNWSLKLVKSPQLAEDIVQEVFLKIWQIRERLNPQQSFPAFIYRISRNKAFSLLKKISSDEKLNLEVMTHLGNAVENTENKLL